MTDWDDFEPYKGPDKKALPAWLEKVIVWLGIVVGLLIVACVGGLLAVVLSARAVGWQINATMGELGVLAGLGASVSVMMVVTWRKK